jgi:hypothetical protein
LKLPKRLNASAKRAKYLLTLLTKIIVAEVEAEAVPTATTTTQTHTSRTPITIAGRDNNSSMVTVGMLVKALHQWCPRMLHSPHRLVHQEEEEEAEMVIAKEGDPPMKGEVEVVDEDDPIQEVDASTTTTIITTIRTLADEVAVDKGVAVLILTTCP